MELGTEIFTYSQGTLGDNQIRVIDILPGTAEDAMRCTLVTIQRDCKEPYRALSYAWGDVAPTHCILVNDKQFWIHKNLFEALKNIRKAEETVRLWTDRMCINQDNVAERNVQVQNMGKTYAGAEEVLIWLGSTTSEGALEDVCYVAKNLSTLSDQELHGKSPSILHVLSQPWFKRLWVIQEATLAQKATVLLGQSSCDLSGIIPLIDITIHQAMVLKSGQNPNHKGRVLRQAFNALECICWTRLAVSAKKAIY